MIHEKEIYFKDIKKIAALDLPWGKIENKSILITGAGFIGSFLSDVLMYRNASYNSKIDIYLMARNEEKAKKKFKDYFNDKLFHFIKHDINIPFCSDISFDYIVHGASNSHPIAYANAPIDTIMTNVIGTYNLLMNLGKGLSKFLFLSTVEIYGENRSDLEEFSENDFGYINCNTLRAGYPESKRASEALCQAFIAEKNIDISIARLCRVYGPSETSDSKASAQFIRNGINKEDIVLKSEGDQRYSYIYIADAVAAILTILFCGEKGVSYNVADKASNVSLFEFASLVAEECKTKIVFDLPNENEKKGFSVVTKAMLNANKLKNLGWYPRTSVKEGIKKTIKILK